MKKIKDRKSRRTSRKRRHTIHTLTKPDNYQRRKLIAINIAAEWWFVNPKLEHDNKNAVNSDW